jgi:hypothetical protein
MGKLYLKNPVIAHLLVVIFSLLGAAFQPLFVFVGGGLALFSLLQSYKQVLSLFLVSTLTLWLVFYFFEGQESSHSWVWLVAFYYVPLILGSLILGQTSNQALSVFFLAILAIMVVLVLTVWGDPYLLELKNILQLAFEQTNTPVRQEALKAMVDAIVPALGVSVFISLTGSLFLGRYWQSCVYKPKGFGEEFRQFQLGKTLNLVLLGIMVLAFLGFEFAEQSFVVVCLLLSLQGLSLVHFFYQKKQWHRAVIIVFYLMLFIVLPLIFVWGWLFLVSLLIISAIIDGWFNLRYRFEVQAE